MESTHNRFLGTGISKCNELNTYQNQVKKKISHLLRCDKGVAKIFFKPLSLRDTHWNNYRLNNI